MSNKLLIDIRQPGWVGCVLAFLALCKVWFVSGLCVPCNVLKIASGSMAKSWVFVYVRNGSIGWHTKLKHRRCGGIFYSSAWNQCGRNVQMFIDCFVAQ